jgi:hypothetical protein
VRVEPSARWVQSDSGDAQLQAQIKKGDAEVVIYWLSRHKLSQGQLRAIEALHGADVEIRHEDNVVFASMADAVKQIRLRTDAGEFVYFVGKVPHYCAVLAAGLCCGYFENHSARRTDGSFGLEGVYHIKDSNILKVWENADPASDDGELLAPAPRT